MIQHDPKSTPAEISAYERMHRFADLVDNERPIPIDDFLEYGYRYFCVNHIVSVINNPINILRKFYEIR